MEIKSGGKVKWNDVNDPAASGFKDLMKREPNKKIKYKKFKRGEGAWYHDGKVHFATTGTHQIWTYDIANETCKVLYKGKGKLKYPDNVTVSNTGLVMAAEDGDNMEICGISNKKNKAFPKLVNPAIAPLESVTTDILKEKSAIIPVNSTPVAI